MQALTSRRKWIQQSSLAIAGLGLSLRSMGNEEGILRTTGVNEGLINLGSNENPYGISGKARQAIMDMMGQTNRYQFNISSLDSFRKTLGAYYGVNEDQVLVTPGSGQGLNLFARHFSSGNIVAPDITFGVLPGTAKKIGTKVIEVPLTSDKLHDLPGLMKAINSETSLVYICNPSNPTGTILKYEDLKNFCESVPKKTVVLIDEAYNEFMDHGAEQTMIPLVHKSKNVLVIKTFSKIHAMAGLRVGFSIGHPDTISRVRPNYFQATQIAVSVLSLNAALASLNDEEHKISSKEKNDGAKQYTIGKLSKLGIEVIPSSTNFIFYPVKNYPGNYAKDMLDKHGIVIRSNNYPEGQWARVSIGTLEEMKKFIDVVKDPKNNMASR